MSTARAIAQAARTAANNKAVRGIALSAGAAAARRAGPILQERYGTWRDHRIDRDRAIKLARQMGGRYSEDTIIDGAPHFVVWKDGGPVQAFPGVSDLRTRPELNAFDHRLTREPPQPREPIRLPKRRKPNP